MHGNDHQRPMTLKMHGSEVFSQLGTHYPITTWGTKTPEDAASECQLHFPRATSWECKGFVSESPVETIWRVWCGVGLFLLPHLWMDTPDRMSSGTNRLLPAKLPLTQCR